MVLQILSMGFVAFREGAFVQRGVAGELSYGDIGHRVLLHSAMELKTPRRKAQPVKAGTSGRFAASRWDCFHVRVS